MKRVFFDMGALLYWSRESIANKRLVSTGEKEPEKEASPEESALEIDPDVRAILQSLKRESFSLNVCAAMPQQEIRETLVKLDVLEYFDNILSAKSTEDMGIGFTQLRSGSEFMVFVGSEEMIVDAALSDQVPCIAYGSKTADVLDKCFCRAGYPFEVEDQIHVLYVVHMVAAHAIKNHSRVLGIDGIAYAGKKVLAEELLEYFQFLGQDATVVDLEDFHRAVEARYKDEDPVESFYLNAYNSEKLIDEVLIPFKQDGFLDRTVFCLDGENDAFGMETEYKVSPTGILILIGTMMYRDPLLPYFDTTVYLRVDYREAEHRASLEEVPIYGDDPLEAYREKNIPAQKMYVSRHDPFNNRDFVIDNSNYHRPFFIR